MIIDFRNNYMNHSTKCQQINVIGYNSIVLNYSMICNRREERSWIGSMMSICLIDLLICWFRRTLNIYQNLGDFTRNR